MAERRFSVYVLRKDMLKSNLKEFIEDLAKYWMDESSIKSWYYNGSFHFETINGKVKVEILEE